MTKRRKIASAVIGLLVVMACVLILFFPVPSSWVTEWVQSNNVDRCETLIVFRPQMRGDVMRMACVHDRPDIVQMLLSKGAQVGDNPADGWPPLYRAAGQESPKTVTLLLDSGANPNVRIDSGKTPLFGPDPLEFRAFKSIIQALLNHGADINAQDNQGDTVLHRWAPLGRARAVQYLLRLGADSSIKNNSGKLPVDLLPEARADNLHAIRLMLQFGQHDIDLSPMYGSPEH